MNMIKLGFIVSIAAVVALSVKLCFSACARAEYEVNGECCPICAPGNHVNWDCSIDTSTTCVACPASTYSDEPSSSSKCFSCSVCEQVVAGRKNIEADRLEEQAPFRLDPHEGVFMSEVQQLPQEKPLETN